VHRINLFSHIQLFGGFRVLSSFAHLDRDKFPAWMSEALWQFIETNIITTVDA
jgi:hypothetical protein